MDLRRYRWDVLGVTEETLRSIAALLSLLHTGGQLLVFVEGDPVEYLAGYLEAFCASVRRVTSGCGANACAYACVLEEAAGSAQLDNVLAREVFKERSHRRYADALDAALAGPRLSVLDVGGGDGHMAEWWMASGHDVWLLEVNEEQARQATTKLGADRVTLHDRRSAWPYDDKSFDVCLLLFVLHHIESEAETQRALMEAARVTKRKVLVMEDQPRAAVTAGLRRLAAAVTAEHFRPFGQDPGVFMRNIRSDEAWRALFSGAGLRVDGFQLIPGTLQHPVPHTLYNLSPVV